MSYSLFIASGTKVLCKSGVVELRGSVYVDGASRDSDGSYRYTVGSKEYICSAGCCQAKETPPAVRHKDGLVWIA
jgi:hypothetical protein